jgi:hypothetical protein
MIYFGISFAVQFICFVVMFNIGFGGQHHSFDSFWMSFFTLWRFLMMDFTEFEALNEDSGALANALLAWFMIE